MTVEYEHQREQRGRQRSDSEDRDGEHREDHFVATAKSLEIPLELWGDRHIRRFVRLVERAHQLHEALTDGVEHVPSGDAADDPAMLRWDVGERCERAELLLRAVIHILEEGFDGRKVGPHYVANKVGNALAPYGIRVLPPRENATRPEEEC